MKNMYWVTTNVVFIEVDKTDHIFSLRIILEKSYDYNVNIHLLHIDCTQACECTGTDQLIEIMKEFEIPS
jgi:hypothetical protein